MTRSGWLQFFRICMSMLFSELMLLFFPSLSVSPISSLLTSRCLSVISAYMMTCAGERATERVSSSE